MGILEWPEQAAFATAGRCCSRMILLYLVQSIILEKTLSQGHFLVISHVCGSPLTEGLAPQVKPHLSHSNNCKMLSLKSGLRGRTKICLKKPIRIFLIGG